VDGNANAKQTLIAAVPEDWKTTPGCPAITWMKTDEFKSHYLILTEVVNMSRNDDVQ